MEATWKSAPSLPSRTKDYGENLRTSNLDVGGHWKTIGWFMYSVSTPEVIILDRVKKNPQAIVRLERMMGAISADRVTETDDAGLAAILEERGWRRPGRTGQFRMERQPALVFGTFRWDEGEEVMMLRERYPVLRGPLLLGDGAWTFRDHRKFLTDYRCVCQSAWELHCAHGCLHACDYCHVPPFFTIMLDLEDLAERVRAFGETIPHQQLYKFDNYTDTICLEPEYGASEIMVSAFADWPGRYLLLYTKSDNVDHLLGLDHRGGTLISWSLSSHTVAAKIEKNTPPVERRIEAMRACEGAGYPVRARISPICPVKNWRAEYSDMIERLLSSLTPEVVTVDVIGWMSAEQMRDALDLSLFESIYADHVERAASEGQRIRGKHLFPHDLRLPMLRFVIEEIKRRRPDLPVSLCNETTDMWRELGPLMGMTPGRYACCCGPTSVPGNSLLQRA